MHLHIPVQAPAIDEQFPANPRKINKWLKNLPLVNIGEVTRQFYKGLTLINRQQCGTKQRVEIIELMRPIARVVLRNLHKHLQSRTFPLPPKTRKIMQLNQAILTEMAYGYKIAIMDYVRGVQKFDVKGATLCTHRAMRYLSEKLCNSSEVYAPDPGNIWQDLHQLYRFALEQRLLTKNIKDNENLDLKKSAILDVYKQVCLLALSRPKSLRQGEAGRLHAYFERTSRWCKIGTQPAPDTNDSVY